MFGFESLMYIRDTSIILAAHSITCKLHQHWKVYSQCGPLGPFLRPATTTAEHLVPETGRGDQEGDAIAGQTDGRDDHAEAALPHRGDQAGDLHRTAVGSPLPPSSVRSFGCTSAALRACHFFFFSMIHFLATVVRPTRTCSGCLWRTLFGS